MTDPRWAKAHDNTLETNSIYNDKEDRYLVSLIVSYDEKTLEDGLDAGDFNVDEDEDDPHRPSPLRLAAAAALDLTRDEGSSGTHWYVFDRKAGLGQYFEQDEFESLASYSEPLFIK